MCKSYRPIVVQTESFASQLLPQYPVFFAEVIDRVALLLAQTTGNGNQEQSKRVKGPAHWASVAPKEEKMLPVSRPDQVPIR
jgi:hypothetical protein